GKAYADGWTKYQTDLAEYEKKKKEFDVAKARTPAADEKKDEKKPEEPKAPDKPQTAEALEPYRALFAGRIPALVEAKREDALRRGLGADDALLSLTTGAAKLVGLENVGSLAVGKDADLVVLSGPPFELSTRVLAVMIDGEWVYQSDD